MFLDVYVLGDGHERNHGKYGSIERAVFTSSKRLRDDLSYLILLCGYYPSIALHTKAGTVTTHRNGVYTQKNDVYSIRINKSQYTIFSSCAVDVISYDGLVYCVELPKYHTLWVMRNGKASWNGNCRCVPYFITESEVDGSVEPVSLTPPTKNTTTETEPTVNPRIAELEKAIEEEQALADKWRKRGNIELAGTFESKVKQYEEELKQLRNPTTTQSQQKPKDTTQEDMINNILSDVLKDVGLEDIAPEKKSINPNVKIEKNIKTTHESNLWENLADKHGFELVEASDTRVTFYDPKFETPIRFNIPKNKDWIDYTNSGLKKRNMEDVLEFYNSATPIQKKAVPIMEIQGKSLDQGTVTIGANEFKLELFEGAFYKMEGSINGGNLKGAMHHEMWHCVDIRMTPEDEARNLKLLNRQTAPIYTSYVLMICVIILLFLALQRLF